MINLVNVVNKKGGVNGSVKPKELGKAGPSLQAPNDSSFQDISSFSIGKSGSRILKANGGVDRQPIRQRSTSTSGQPHANPKGFKTGPDFNAANTHTSRQLQSLESRHAKTGSFGKDELSRGGALNENAKRRYTPSSKSTHFQKGFIPSKPQVREGEEAVQLPLSAYNSSNVFKQNSMHEQSLLNDPRNKTAFNASSYHNIDNTTYDDMNQKSFLLSEGPLRMIYDSLNNIYQSQTGIVEQP
jgi:hypothetical protein